MILVFNLNIFPVLKSMFKNLIHVLNKLVNLERHTCFASYAKYQLFCKMVFEKMLISILKKSTTKHDPTFPQEAWFEQIWFLLTLHLRMLPHRFQITWSNVFRRIMPTNFQFTFSPSPPRLLSPLLLVASLLHRFLNQMIGPNFLLHFLLILLLLPKKHVQSLVFAYFFFIIHKIIFFLQCPKSLARSKVVFTSVSSSAISAKHTFCRFKI